jgi:DNA-binding PadR family transcriptional regulator
MNLTRLMVLGTLARFGPQHGHQIRRVADVTNVGEWGGVSVGALYRELRAMEGEGLVEALRTEKVGNRPARTVYAITQEGRLELLTLREQAIKPFPPGPDPFAVALGFGTDGVPIGDLRRTLRARRDMLAIAAREISAEREHHMAHGLISIFEAANMRRGALRLEAEVRWHDEFDAELAQAGAATGPRAIEGTLTRAIDGGDPSAAEKPPGGPDADETDADETAHHGPSANREAAARTANGKPAGPVPASPVPASPVPAHPAQANASLEDHE